MPTPPSGPGPGGLLPSLRVQEDHIAAQFDVERPGLGAEAAAGAQNAGAEPRLEIQQVQVIRPEDMQTFKGKPPHMASRTQDDLYSGDPTNRVTLTHESD